MGGAPRIQYRIPNLHRYVPSLSYPGPHPETNRAAKECVDWLSSYEPFGPLGATRRFFEKTNVGVLGGYGFPYAPYDGMRASLDVINVIITLDEITDHQNGKDARAIMENHLRVLFGGECDGSPVSKISAE